MQPRVVKRPYSRLAIKPSIVRVLIIRAGLIMPIKISYDRGLPREFHLTEFLHSPFSSFIFFFCFASTHFPAIHPRTWIKNGFYTFIRM